MVLMYVDYDVHLSILKLCECSQIKHLYYDDN